MRALEINDNFRFAEEVRAIHLKNFFDGFTMGHQAPSDVAREVFRPELLGDEITIPQTDTLVVIEAYPTTSGWYVRAKWHDHIVHFHQAEVDGLTFFNPSVVTLPVTGITEGEA